MKKTIEEEKERECEERKRKIKKRELMIWWFPFVENVDTFVVLLAYTSVHYVSFAWLLLLSLSETSFNSILLTIQSLYSSYSLRQSLTVHIPKP